MPSYDKYPQAPKGRLDETISLEGAVVSVREGEPVPLERASKDYQAFISQLGEDFEIAESSLDLELTGVPTDTDAHVRLRVPASRYGDATWVVVDNGDRVISHPLAPGETEYELLLKAAGGLRAVAAVKEKDPSLSTRIAEGLSKLLDRVDTSGRKRRGLDRVAQPLVNLIPGLALPDGGSMPIAFAMSDSGPAPGSAGNAVGDVVDAVASNLSFGVACRLSQPMLFRTRVRTFTPENHDELMLNSAQVLDKTSDWSKYHSPQGGPEKRTLLFIHGTGMQSHVGFDGLASKPDGSQRTLLRDLYDHYEGRVLAFDHRTISDTPYRNLELLAESMPNGVRLSVDIIAVSRGCMLARLIAEGFGRLNASLNIDVQKAVLVAGANNGTLMGASVSAALCLRQVRCHRYNDNDGANLDLAAFIPASAWGGNLLQAVAIGVACLVPNSAELRKMNGFMPQLPTVTGAPVYYRIASNYGTADSEVACAQDYFRENGVVRPNDLVVPRGPALQPDLGPTWQDHIASRGQMFEDLPDRKLSFAPADHVTHVDYFGQAQTHVSIRNWLLNANLPPQA